MGMNRHFKAKMNDDGGADDDDDDVARKPRC